MLNEQELISKAISEIEISELREIIIKNKISDNDKILYEYKEWYSSEGESFQTSKTIENAEYQFEINSEGEIHVLGTLNDLMTEDDNLIIEMTDDCEKKFQNLSDKVQDEIINKTEYFGELYITNRTEFFRNAHQPLFFKLNDKFDSSLYYFRINKDLKIIASVDEDPIFESVTITLLDVFKDNDIEKNFKSAAQSFYRQFINVEQI